MKSSWMWPGLTALGLAFVFLPLAATDWREFRGPNRSGVSDAKDVPTTWDAKTNILWKTELPGPGTSSPVLFGEKIYLTCYTGYGLDAKNPGDGKNLKRHLLCIKRTDGTIAWDTEMPAKVEEPGYGGFTALHGFASSTPAVDDDGIYVFYGASGAAAYTHEGKFKWEKSCGTKHYEDWGSASSPVLYKDLVIIHADVESETIFAFNRKTGREVWKQKFTPEGKNSQHTRATPLIVKRPGGDELIIHSRMNWVSALDPATGKVLWEYKGTKSYQHASIVT
ncbi:MAG: PQQ-like beta-propeller repeat protein, partial [Planctomycetia bacterium]|nr:PQQ-like beta-propeller repeat protein [Planctomycetia bacterium]